MKVMKPSSHPISQSFFLFLLFVVVSITVVGCPGPTVGPGPDGGINNPDDSTITPPKGSCTEGAYCVFVNKPEQNIRSCQLKFKIPDGATLSSVEFGSEIRGRHLEREGALGLAFVWREHKNLAETAAAVIRVPKELESKSLNWEFQVKECFDEKGQKVENPDISIGKK